MDVERAIDYGAERLAQTQFRVKSLTLAFNELLLFPTMSNYNERTPTPAARGLATFSWFAAVW